MPSYLGSKVQSLPSGMSVPTEASMGSSTPALSAFADVARADAEGVDGLLRAGSARGVLRLAAGGADLGSRLECHTRALLFSAISSIVRPVVTEVVTSATMSLPGLEYSSRCLMSSHCGFSSEPRRVRTSTHDPCIRLP